MLFPQKVSLEDLNLHTHVEQHFGATMPVPMDCGDEMNGLIDTDVNEELTSPRIDNDEDLSASSEDIYGAD
ncbi:hypothetical protein E4U22_005440 [Claviceps purpurea]|nr:hypothetical protein E4U22_005440 [Claviceps purpurea]